MGLLSFRHTPNISFTRFKMLPILLLVSMFLMAGLGYVFKGLNLGIDFKGGILVEAQLLKAPNLSKLRSELKESLKQEVTLQQISKPENTLMIRLESSQKSEESITTLKKVLGEGTVYRKIDSIGPKVGQELINSSAWATFWAMIAIFAYVWFRFEWSFAISALLSLLHDCAGILAFFCFFGMEFNEGAIISFLITVSYSINDTVVIFDRLRENKGYRKTLSWRELINLSINETLSRTILTSATTLLALGLLYLLGGEVIAIYSLPLFVGIIIGTYSSIMISAPLLSWFHTKAPGKHVIK